MKQIPYGLTDFGRIQKENYYYVDKTMFIEKIEMQPSYLFLIRPDASGKASRWRCWRRTMMSVTLTSSTNCSGSCISGNIPHPYITSFSSWDSISRRWARISMRWRNLSGCIAAGSFLILFTGTDICWEKTSGKCWMKKQKKSPALFVSHQHLRHPQRGHQNISTDRWIR